MFQVATSSVSTIRLAGEIDLSSVEQLDAALALATAEGGAITLDLADVTFLSSSALHSILKAAAALGDEGCILIHGHSDIGMIERLFELSKIDEARNIHVISHG
jgi:anti-anti-sigma factor